jgi:hypothetical protein
MTRHLTGPAECVNGPEGPADVVLSLLAPSPLPSSFEAKFPIALQRDGPWRRSPGARPATRQSRLLFG